jgi:cell division topological specificity factor
MFENIMNFFKSLVKKEKSKESSDTAKERLHLVLMQDRANVSADFLELMKQEIIEVIKKYIDVDEKEIDVHLTNKANEDGTVGAPALYANIPIVTIKNEARKLNVPKQQEENNNEKEKSKETENKPKKEEKKEEKVEETEKVKEENEVDSTQEESKETENTTNTEENKGEENKGQKVEDNISEQEDKETETSNN